MELHDGRETCSINVLPPVSALRSFDVPFFGLYGACSTMAESLILGSCLVSGGYGNEYGDVHGFFAFLHRRAAITVIRWNMADSAPLTAQWTATASGAVVLLLTDRQSEDHPSLPGGTSMIRGLKMQTNMGAAMAQSAYETLHTYFKTKRRLSE